MKAYRTWDEKALDPCATIVFAENIKEAKKIAMATDTCEEANFIDIRVKRLKEADYLYKGSNEIDWYDEETRIALVRDFGWRCYKIFRKQNFCLMTFLFRKLMIIFATIIFSGQELVGLFSKISPNFRCYISTQSTENMSKSARGFGFAQKTGFERM